MPDIKTAFRQALATTLNDWDDEGEAAPVQPVSIPTQPTTQPTMTKQLFPIKNNISRITFNYVRDNPGSTRKEILQALDYQGFGQGSTSSLLSQLCKNGLAHNKDGLYYADVPEYRPLKGTKAVKKATPEVKRKYEKKSTTGVTGIGALLREKLEVAPTITASEPLLHTTQRKALISLVRTKTPNDILSDLTVYQARELYDHLKKIFGG
jgi:hypothetical protein